MQDLLLRLLRENDLISHKVYQLVQAAPEYQAAAQDYKAVEHRVHAILGDALYDEYVSAFLRLSSCENTAYYAVGLGLRQELARLWLER